MLESCVLCPRQCGVNRIKGELGFCQAPLHPKIARAALHFWEEPCLSGERGSGAVFFSHCNLRCVYCQNYQISQGAQGTEVDIPSLAGIFLDLEQQGAHNINLVSPTPYIPQIAETIRKARVRGLKIPVIFNSHGYESVSALRLLEGLVDIYLPDLKYVSGQKALAFSGAADYFAVATGAIGEMLRQVETPVYDKNNLLSRGLVIRHLLLPGQFNETSAVLHWIAQHLPPEVAVSLMAQYIPMYHAKEIPPLNRRISKREYDRALELLFDLGLENGYVQERTAADECYVPPFDGTGVLDHCK